MKRRVQMSGERRRNLKLDRLLEDRDILSQVMGLGQYRERQRARVGHLAYRVKLATAHGEPRCLRPPACAR